MKDADGFGIWLFLVGLTVGILVGFVLNHFAAVWITT